MKRLCGVGMLVAVLVLAGCGASGPGPTTWLDRPLDGTTVPLGPVTVQAHASDADGVASFEFFVDNVLLATAPGGGGRLGEAIVGWTPTDAGTYTVRARAIDTQGHIGSEASAVVVVGELVLTPPTPSPTPERPSVSPPGEVQITFTADRTNLQPGECATLQWSVQGGFGVGLDGQPVEKSGQKQVCPGETTPYRLGVDTGQTIEERVVKIVVEGAREPPPPEEHPTEEQPPEGRGVEVVNLRVEPDVIPPGGCAMLRWEVLPPGDWPVLLDGQEVPHVGEKEVCPEHTTTYELLAEAPGGPQERAVTLQVEGGLGPEPPPEVQVSFTADRTHLRSGECATLRWSVQGGEVAQLNGQPVDLAGQQEVCPQETTSYALAVYVGGGPPNPPKAEREVVISVEGAVPLTPTPPIPSPTPTSPPTCPGPPVIAFFTANPSTITAGQSSTLSWGAVTNATSAVIDQGIGGVGTPGSVVVKPATTTTYIMTATGCGGTTTQQVTVVVNPAPPQPSSADLAVTDLYPQTLYGPVYGRITNHGPASLTNVTIQFSCQWVKRDPIEGTQETGQIGPKNITITSLSPGQTTEFNTTVAVDLHGFRYDMTCTIHVPINDPNGANNSYSETFP